ncbi:hypothetical protein IJV79_00945, partial [bacterium]|nr:hypothetical protein [bacterium]
AYQGTLNIDGALGLDEPFIVENSNNILPNVTMALSWDYDYIYVLMYHNPSNAQTNCFKTATVTIGGATATVNVDESTISGCDGAKVFTNYYAIEMAIPLSAVTLDEVALANGIALVKFDMTLNSIEDGEEATNTFAYDAILSGRSLISRIVDLNNNPGAKETNGYRGFNGANGFYNVTTGADVADKTGMTNQVFTPDRTNWNLVDASGVDGLVRIYSLFSGINEFVATSNGTGSHFDFQLNVTNLPAGTIDTSKVGAGIGVNANSNNAPVISFFAGGKGGAGLGGDTRGAHLYNDVNNGLSLVYTTKENGADVTKTVDLGVEMGELFKLGFTQNLDGTIDILVNEAKIAEAYEYGFALTGSQGAFWFQSMRGKTGLGDSGYSLDLNKNGTIDDNEKIAFQMTNFVVCALNEVDVATVASITKNNATPSSTMIFAGSKYADGSKVNVASMAKAYATYDLDEGMVYLNVSNVNIDAIKLNVGGLDANVTYSSGYGAAIVDSTSDKVTATIDANKA